MTCFMKHIGVTLLFSSGIIALLLLWTAGVTGQDTDSFDDQVQTFLKKNENKWEDLNIPPADGKVLYDIIVSHGYKRALEIGTSTGHSGIWIAWGLSKTGGRLITIEIDEERYHTALENFRKAGVAGYIDTRLGDAHEIVGNLEGPFDFVFSDADKGWYTRYLQLIMPKLTEGGCFTAHNVLNTYWDGIPQFLKYVKSLSSMETTIIESSPSGLSVSYLRKKQ